MCRHSIFHGCAIVGLPTRHGILHGCAIVSFFLPQLSKYMMIQMMLSYVRHGNAIVFGTGASEPHRVTDRPPQTRLSIQCIPQIKQDKTQIDMRNGEDRVSSEHVPPSCSVTGHSVFITTDQISDSENYAIICKTWQCESEQNRGERAAPRHRPATADTPQHPIHSSCKYDYEYL